MCAAVQSTVQFLQMPAPGELAKLKAEIERLEKAFRECTDSGIRKVIEGWMEDARKRLAFTQKSSIAKSSIVESRTAKNTAQKSR